MHSQPEFVAIFSYRFRDSDEVAAILTCEHITQEVEKIIDDEDVFSRVDLLEASRRNPRPVERAIALRRARNILIATRDAAAFETAQRLDRLAFQIERQEESDMPRADYRESDFYLTAEKVFRGENPLD